MRLVRRWLYPAAWLLVGIVITAALVKIAFQPGDEGKDDVPAATGELLEPTVSASMGAVSSTLTLSGTVSAVQAVPTKALSAGEVDYINVKVGRLVKKGDLLFSVRKPVESTTPTPHPSTSVVKPTSTKTAYRYFPSYATSTGVVSYLSVDVGESVDVGDVVVQIAPKRFEVTGTIKPVQLYALSNKTTNAQVTINGGPGAFQCTSFQVDVPLAGATGASDASSSTQGASDPSTGSISKFRCEVPDGLKVFPGLVAKVVKQEDRVEGVVIIPITAVSTTGTVSSVYVKRTTGRPVRMVIKLGISDGENVQVTSGLKAGARVLQFYPSAGN